MKPCPKVWRKWSSRDCHLFLSLGHLTTWPLGPRPRPRGHLAYSLIELVVSLSVMSILFLAIGSSFVIASRAIPANDNQALQTLTACNVMHQLVEELATAVAVSAYSPTMIEFVVDRSGTNHTIRYEWLGVPASPGPPPTAATPAAITRQYDGATVVVMIPDAVDFNLTYSLSAATQTQQDPDTISAEVELTSYTAPDTSADLRVNSNDWIGQYFKPTLAPNAAGWTVTKVMFRAKADGGTSGLTMVQLRSADASNLPVDTVLDQQALNEEDLLSAYTWQLISFNNAMEVAAGTGLCLVFQWLSDKHSAKIEYDSRASNTGGSNRLVTTDGGASWSLSGSTSMLYRVYGTIRTRGAVTATQRDFLAAVTVQLKIDKNQPSHRLFVQTVNEPEVTGL